MIQGQITEQAECPSCLGWFDVKCEDYVAPHVEVDADGKETVLPIHVWGWWWKDSAGCPGCGAMVLVESECNFRKVKA